MIEALESRRLLSAVYYDPGAHSIVIHGTRGNDRIDVIHRHDGVLVKMNGRRRWFRNEQVQQADIVGRSGDDVIDASWTSFRVNAIGGDGRDTILTGWGNDYIDGGAGADRIAAGAGDDDIRAGGGRDRLTGMAGNDTLDGQGNNDKLDGGAGDDYFNDGEGANIIDGGAGVDWAVRFADRGTITRVEGQSFLSPVPSADPYVHMAIFKSADMFFLRVIATHFMGGYERNFGDMTRNGNVFTAGVSGEDLAGPNSARDAALHTEQHIYTLGILADGTYTVTAASDTRALATMRIQIKSGNAVNAPTWPGPYGGDLPTPIIAFQ